MVMTKSIILAHWQLCITLFVLYTPPLWVCSPYYRVRSMGTNISIYLLVVLWLIQYCILIPVFLILTSSVLCLFHHIHKWLSHHFDSYFDTLYRSENIQKHPCWNSKQMWNHCMNYMARSQIVWLFQRMDFHKDQISLEMIVYFYIAYVELRYSILYHQNERICHLQFQWNSDHLVMNLHWILYSIWFWMYHHL